MLLYVKVRPNQRFNKVEQHETAGRTPRWTLSIKAPARDGEANEQLVDFLSSLLDIPRSAIALKHGAAARFKCLEIQAAETEVLARLARACN